jgi:hypothetical protein
MTDYIERKIDSKFPVCPYAKNARLSSKIKFVDSREKFTDVPLDNFEIIVHWIGESFDKQYYDSLLKSLNKKNKNKLYFLSTTESGYFVKNFTNCVFVQDKNDILDKRNILHKLDYYENWPKEYYKEITEK